MNIYSMIYFALLIFLFWITGCLNLSSIPGDPRAFKTVDTFSEVSRLAGTEAKLLSFRVGNVTADGLIDFKRSEHPSWIEYEFIVKATSADVRAIKADSVKAGDHIEAKLSVGTIGGAAGLSTIERTVRKRRNDKPIDMVYVPEPIVSIADICSKAQKKGLIKSDEKYQISYEIQGYVVRNNSKFFRLVFSDDGTLLHPSK